MKESRLEFAVSRIRLFILLTLFFCFSFVAPLVIVSDRKPPDYVMNIVIATSLIAILFTALVMTTICSQTLRFEIDSGVIVAHPWYCTTTMEVDRAHDFLSLGVIVLVSSVDRDSLVLPGRPLLTTASRRELSRYAEHLPQDHPLRSVWI